jgi:hypothetical protein
MAGETRVGEFDAVITDVEGNAYLTGYHQFDEKEYRSLSTGEIARVDATGNPAATHRYRPDNRKRAWMLL